MREDTHVSSVFVDAPFDIVWAWITDPLRFPTIYPNWTSEVTRGPRGEGYEGVAPNGDTFKIVPKLDRAHGVADFEIVDEEGNVELSRARVFPLKAGGCAIIHLAYRWGVWVPPSGRTSRPAPTPILSVRRRSSSATPPASRGSSNDTTSRRSGVR